MGDSTFVPNSTGRLRKVLLCPPAYSSFLPINEITHRACSPAARRPDLEAAFARASMRS